MTSITALKKNLEAKLDRQEKAVRETKAQIDELVELLNDTNKGQRK